MPLSGIVGSDVLLSHPYTSWRLKQQGLQCCVPPNTLPEVHWPEYISLNHSVLPPPTHSILPACRLSTNSHAGSNTQSDAAASPKGVHTDWMTFIHYSELLLMGHVLLCQRWTKYTFPLLESKCRYSWLNSTPIQVKIFTWLKVPEYCFYKYLSN